MGQHAPKPPSSAHLWRHCGLAPVMIAAYPQDDTIETLEGTAAHEYVTGSFMGQLFEAGTDIASNGIVISQEMIDAGEDILDDLRKQQSMFRHVKGSPEIQVEKRIHAVRIHPSDVWGTCDFFAVDWANRVIYAWEYKYGHRYVEEFRNPQAVAYFDGIMVFVGLTPDDALRDGWRFRFAVAQPRCYDRRGSFREWIFEASELLVEVEKLRQGAALPADHAQTGDHCRDCPGAHACEALRMVGGASIDISRRSVPEDIGPSNVGLEIKFLHEAKNRLEARLDALEQQADFWMKNGQNVPLVMFEIGYGKETWKVPKEEAIAIADAFGANIRKEDTVTPKQAREANKDNPDLVEALKAISYTPLTGKRKLKLVDDLEVAKAFRGKVVL